MQSTISKAFSFGCTQPENTQKPLGGCTGGTWVGGAGSVLWMLQQQLCMNGGCSKSAALSSEHHCEVTGMCPQSAHPWVPIAAHCIQPGRHFPTRNTWKRAKGVGRKEGIKQRKHSAFKASVQRLERNKSTFVGSQSCCSGRGGQKQ